MIHITLYLDEIPSDHATWSWVFVCMFLTELKQLQSFAWNCSLFQILTDHRPLLSLFGNRKGFPVHSGNRLQHWSAAILGYDFRIAYRKSKDFGKVDTFPRLILSHSALDEDVVFAALQAEFDMDVLTSYLPVTSDKLRSITEKDELLQSEKKSIKSRWPVLRLLRQHADWSHQEGFYRHRDSLTIEQGCILFREPMVIPTAMRTRVLNFLRQGHSGIQLMKSLARNIAYWPGMEHDIEEMVRLCVPCAGAAQKPVKVTLQSRPPATKPWKRIRIDLAGPHLGRQFLKVVNAYLNYTDVISVSSTTSRQTFGILRKLCAQHSVLEIIVSDIGMQFTSHEFTDLVKANAIRHILSPP